MCRSFIVHLDNMNIYKYNVSVIYRPLDNMNIYKYNVSVIYRPLDNMNIYKYNVSVIYRPLDNMNIYKYNVSSHLSSIGQNVGNNYNKDYIYNMNIWNLLHIQLHRINIDI